MTEPEILAPIGADFHQNIMRTSWHSIRTRVESTLGIIPDVYPNRGSLDPRNTRWNIFAAFPHERPSPWHPPLLRVPSPGKSHPWQNAGFKHPFAIQCTFTIQQPSPEHHLCGSIQGVFRQPLQQSISRLQPAHVPPRRSAKNTLLFGIESRFTTEAPLGFLCVQCFRHRSDKMIVELTLPVLTFEEITRKTPNC